MSPTTGTAATLRGDALHLPLPDESVDLIVTSPPYFGLRSYQDGGEHYAGQIGSEATPAEFVDALIAATREMVRVLKPSGSIWVNLGDKYSSGGRGTYDLDPGRREVASSRPQDGARPKSLLGVPWRYAIRCIDELGLILREEVIWDKPNGLPESVTDRCARKHETWFHFTVAPKYYACMDEIREPHIGGGHPGLGARHQRSGGVLAATRSNVAANPLGKLPGSVWTIATQPLRVPVELNVQHFAAFPMAFPQRIIAGWCPPGGVVVDPFGGTGTAALVAKALGRRGVSVDMSADYCRLATWRTTNPDQLAKAAMQVKKPVKRRYAARHDYPLMSRWV